jgi:predicted kinase
VVRARTVVVLTGLPGTGKSTLADLLAGDVGSPAFAGDWLLGALAPHGILDGVARSTLLAAYYDLLARRRVESRRRGIPGWHEVGWDHVARMRREFRPVTDKQLTLDAVNPVDDNLRLLAALTAD